MRDFAMYQVDAFADRLFTGNPAAVMVLDAPLPDALMQAIAAENNQSETAFVERVGDAYSIRWFTPSQEAAFCGHATLASAHVLIAEFGDTGPLAFKTREVGTLRVGGSGGRYELDLPRIDAGPMDEIPAGLAAMFPDGWAEAVQNFENIFVVLRSADAVRSFVPDAARIAALGHGCIGITAKGGTDRSGAPVDFTSRYFAPGHGIEEDPVTGSTHATLAPYWAGRLGKSELTAYQASARGGAVGCRVTADRVILGGTAVTYLKGTIRLPV